MIVYRIDIPPHIAEVIGGLPPDVKKSVRCALNALRGDPGIGLPLVRELKGLWKYRVRRFRIVYVVDSARRVIRIFAVGHRSTIYEDALKLLRPGR